MFTTTQKGTLLAISLLVAFTRLLPIAASPLDWDEGLFALAVDNYDVEAHHPHPPGYPLFIAAAKAVHFLGVGEYRSLQIIVVLGALFLFPVLVFLARAVGCDFITAMGGAALFAFLPQVWIYGGTGFSDLPAATLSFVAAALLLTDRSGSWKLAFGAITLAVATGIRPSTLLVGAVPLAIAIVKRIRARELRALGVALALCAAIVAGSYLGSALASTGVPRFASAIESQSEHVARIDSFRNPERPPLRETARIFLVEPILESRLTGAIALLALVSFFAALVRRHVAPLLMVAMFAPLAVASWLALDHATAARYSISYMALHALLAADGVRIIGRIAPARIALTTALVAASALWTWPAVVRQRMEKSPPAAALEWVRSQAPRGSTIFVDEAMLPLGKLLLPDHHLKFFRKSGEILALAPDAWVVEARRAEIGVNFSWPHDTLWKIVRRRNFEVSVSRLDAGVRLGAGWHGEERSGDTVFHWMAAESSALLPSFGQEGELRLILLIPIELIPEPTIEIYLNGELLERLVANTTSVRRSYRALSRAGDFDELRITTSATVRPSEVSDSSDTRELGLRLNSISWSPVR